MPLTAALIFATVISAQPLANPAVLSPSVLNEVERALDVAATNPVPVSAASVAFAAACATNRLSATDQAIRLVSSQKNGRWFWQGVEVTPVATRILRRLAGFPEPPLRLSVFANHLENLARQEKISFEEAVRRAQSLGVVGVDVMQGISDDCLAALKRCGLQIACVIGFTQFERHYDERQCAALIDLARTNGCTMVMLVPGFYPTTNVSAAVQRTILTRTRRFAAAAAKHGLETVVEDFDDLRSPTCGHARLNGFFAADARLGFVFDTGNFYEAGGRPEDGLRFLDRVRHLHLKDRAAAAAGAASVANGRGVVPLDKLISSVRDVGYGGWFTVEHFCVTNMQECLTQSVRYLTHRSF